MKIHAARLSSLVLGIACLSLAAGCSAGPMDEAEGGGAAAQSTREEEAAPVVRSGTYGQDGDLQLAVTETKSADGDAMLLFSGSFYSQIGDPSRGGATCTFTFAAPILKERYASRMPIKLVDAWDSRDAVLVINGNDRIGIHMTGELPNACSRVLGDVMADADGYQLTRTGAQEVTNAVAYDTVKSERAYFYDVSGGTKRSAYVVMGDAVALSDWAPSASWVTATFVGAGGRKTTGAMMASDLANLSR